MLPTYIRSAGDITPLDWVTRQQTRLLMALLLLLLQVAADPNTLYPMLIDSPAVATLASLLSHDNTDIAMEVMDLLQELTDAGRQDGLVGFRPPPCISPVVPATLLVHAVSRTAATAAGALCAQPCPPHAALHWVMPSSCLLHLAVPCTAAYAPITHAAAYRGTPSQLGLQWHA